MRILGNRLGGILWMMGLFMIGVGDVSARESFIAVDAHSGKVLVEYQADQRKPVASLTKLATAAVLLDWAKVSQTNLATRVQVPNTVSQIGGSNPLGLRAGDQIGLREAMYSMLLGSDNAAAHTIATYVGYQIRQKTGGRGVPRDLFVKEMNRLAKHLGMSATKFANAHGMDSARERGSSSARDMARLSMYAMKNAGLMFYVKQKSRTISFFRQGQKLSFKVSNTNDLLGRHSINGLKTGHTGLAGACVALSAQRKSQVVKLADGRTQVFPRRLAVVVLGCEDRASCSGRAASLVNQGWSAVERWRQEGMPATGAAQDFLQVPNPK